MRFFITDRQRGKTTKAIKEGLKIGEKEATCLLTFNDASARAIRTAFRPQLLGSKLEVFSLPQFGLIGKNRKFKNIYIDDVDQILYAMVHESLAEDGAIRLATATGLPVHDMSVLREAAAALWEEAAAMVLGEFGREEDTPVEVRHVAGIMRRKAAELLAQNKPKGGVVNENRDGGEQGDSAGSVQQSDPAVDGGKV